MTNAESSQHTAQPTFWEVFWDAIQYNWNDHGISGKLLVIALFATLALGFGMVAYGIAWVIA